jgi:hypothetical protein
MPDTSSSISPSIFALRPLHLGLMLLLAFGSVGCGVLGPDGNVWVYVDNGGDKPMVVKVEGQDEVTIDPGQFEKLALPPGEKRFHVKRGDQVLFDGTQDLQPSDEFGNTRRYFFNPDQRSRYAILTVKYGGSRLDGVLESYLKGSPKDAQSARRVAYEKLANEVKLLPSTAWFEVPTGAFVLTPLPQVVVTRGYSEQRTVLTRVDPKDYAFIEAARAKQNPTAADLKALSEVVNRVLDSEP